MKLNTIVLILTIVKCTGYADISWWVVFLPWILHLLWITLIVIKEGS